MKFLFVTKAYGSVKNGLEKVGGSENRIGVFFSKLVYWLNGGENTPSGVRFAGLSYPYSSIISSS